MANQVVELLFGVQGGAHLNGQSGVKIKEDILGIVQNLKGTKYTQVEFNATVSTESLTKLRTDVENALKDVKVAVVFDKKEGVTSGSDNSGPGSSGGKNRAKKDLAESVRINKLIKQYKIYYEWLNRAATVTPGDGAKQQAYFEASEAALKRATNMMQEYKLEGESLAKVEEARAEMQRRFDVQADAFVGGLFDRDAIKKAKDELAETLGLYKAAHKLAMAAEKAPAESNVKAELSAMAEKMREDADEARLVYDLHGKRGIEIDRLLTEQRRELADATRLQAAAEKDAANKETDSALKKRSADLEKIADAYRRVGEAQKRKNLAHSQKESDNADKDVAKALQTAEALRRALGMTKDEWAELRAILSAEGVQLQSAHQALAKYTNAEAAAADRAKEAMDRSNAEQQESLQTLQRLHKAIQQFDLLATKQSTIAIVDGDSLNGFAAKVETVRATLRQLGLDAATADYNLEDLSQVSGLDDMLFQVQSMLQGLKNLVEQTGGLTTANTKLETSYHKLANRAHDYMVRIQSTLSRDPGMMQEMQNLVDRLHRGDFESVARGAQEFQKLQFRIKQAGLEAETLGQQVSRIFKEKFGFGVMATAAMYARSAISDVARTVVDLDTKLTELKIVSGETGQAMAKYFDDAAAAAKRVASSITDIIDATTVYRRLGFEMSKSLDFAELTTMYSKVGAVDMSQAEENITAIIKAYNLEDINDLRYALDQMVATGNNLPISASGLGQALNNAASSLTSAGNNFQESLALITASNTITQDPDKASTALRTISARLRQSTVELEDLGEELDETYNTVSSYQAKFKSLTGVDILEEDQKTYKSTYQILKELSEVWETLSEMDKQAVTYMAAGIRQGNVFSSIMTEFDDAEKTLKVTAEAAGSMQSAYENYIDSIQGRLNTLTASSQELFNNLLDSDLIKGGVSAVTALVEALNWFIETIGVLPTVGAGVGLYKLISSVGGAKLIALINAPTYVPVVTRSELAA